MVASDKLARQIAAAVHEATRPLEALDATSEGVPETMRLDSDCAPVDSSKTESAVPVKGLFANPPQTG